MGDLGAVILALRIEGGSGAEFAFGYIVGLMGFLVFAGAGLWFLLRRWPR